MLRRFDVVLLIDDSASMQQQNRWAEAEQAIRAVAEKVVLYDAVSCLFPSPLSSVSLPLFVSALDVG